MTDIDEELAALYRAARAQEAPTRADRRAVQVAVAAALTTTAVATSAQAVGGLATSHAVKALAAGKVLVWLCGGVAIGAVLSSVAWVATSQPEQAQPSASTAPTPTARPGSTQRDPARLAPTAVPSLARGTASEPASDPRSFVAPRVAPRSSDRNAVEGAPPSLLAESQGVQAVQQALANGRAARALSLLAEQERQFRGGALAEERAALRVLALCATDQADAAESARQHFLATYPRSPHAPRVRESCTK